MRMFVIEKAICAVGIFETANLVNRRGMYQGCRPHRIIYVSILMEYLTHLLPRDPPAIASKTLVGKNIHLVFGYFSEGGSIGW